MGKLHKVKNVRVGKLQKENVCVDRLYTEMSVWTEMSGGQGIQGKNVRVDRVYKVKMSAWTGYTRLKYPLGQGVQG